MCTHISINASSILNIRCIPMITSGTIINIINDKEEEEEEEEEESIMLCI